MLSGRRLLIGDHHQLPSYAWDKLIERYADDLLTDGMRRTPLNMESLPQSNQTVSQSKSFDLVLACHSIWNFVLIDKSKHSPS